MIYRGTTPTITINVIGLPVTELITVFVTFVQGEVRIEKTGEEIEFSAEGNALFVSLTQEDTLSLIPNVAVWVQVRAITIGGERVASNIGSYDIRQILKDGVI